MQPLEKVIAAASGLYVIGAVIAGVAGFWTEVLYVTACMTGVGVIGGLALAADARVARYRNERNDTPEREPK